MLERFKVPANEQVYVEEEALRHTVTSIFEKVGLSRTDAMESADVLVTADLRGVESHGVSNMLRRYVIQLPSNQQSPKHPLTP
jgi:LDH2 family malate/lactate/ureidoglycolate dehydrogenase